MVEEMDEIQIEEKARELYNALKTYLELRTPENMVLGTIEDFFRENFGENS